MGFQSDIARKRRAADARRMTLLDEARAKRGAPTSTQRHAATIGQLQRAAADGDRAAERALDAHYDATGY